MSQIGEYEAAMESAVNDVVAEIHRAKLKHPGNFHNFHHGYAVFLEEADELWDKIKEQKHDALQIREEAIQAAAMLVRIVVELT